MATQKLHTLVGLTAALVLGLSVGARAQQLSPADAQSAQISDAIAQSAGEFDQVNLNYIHSLGMQQKAWNDPLSHMGDGQTKPGYSKYMWSPDVVLPIRLREGMMTLINLPTWELIEKVHIGSPESFGGEIAAPNSLLVYADPSYIGVDSNMIIFGRSGNRYVFYLRSETYNTDKITQSVVDVLVGPRFTPIEFGGKLGDYNGASATAAGTPSLTGGNLSGWGKTGTAGGNGNVAASKDSDWLKTIPVDPESFRFDIDMYLPNPEDVDIAPDNVWRDNIFTYIDLGPKALTMTQRPIVNLIVQDVEVPVGFRTRGPNSRLIVVEAIGDLVLRNGKKLICLKLRRDPASGLEYTDYSGSQSAGFSGMAAPSVQADNVYAAPKGNGVAGMPAAPQVPMTMNGQAITRPNAMGTQQMPYNYAPTYPAMNSMAPIGSIPQNVMQSEAASAGIVGVMNGFGGAYQAPALSQVTDKETISVELGTHANIAELETVWDTIYDRNNDLLNGYEPYYSVDATADGGMRELFRLRVGPVQDIKTADTLCKKLGRRGFSCSVIRVQ